MTHWPLLRLGEVVRFVGGGTPSRDRAEYWNGDIPWASVKDLTSTILSVTQECITGEGLRNSASNLVPQDTVVIASRVGLGKAAITLRPLAINQDLKALIPKGETLLAKYLLYFFLAIADRIEAAGVGATVKGVSVDFLSSILIPIPPIAEQKRLVHLFDEATTIRDLRTKSDQQTSQAPNAIFLHLFGDPIANPCSWPLVSAGDLMVLCEYGTSRKADERGEGTPILRMNNVTADGRLVLRDVKTVVLESEELDKYRLQDGDILFNRTNSRDLVGKTGIWDGRYEAVAASYFIRVRFDAEREDPVHFASFMNLPTTKRRLFNIARGAIGQANINSKELQELLIPVPPIGLQRAFAEQVRQVREIEAIQAQTRTQVNELFVSLLDIAFQGRR